MFPVIVHLDMNSYFASCEQQDNISWRGVPVGVCEHLGGIIIAASIEAKKLGIKTGTPVWEAKRIYPKIILTPTHADRYRMYTERLIRVVSDYVNVVEKYSIDEVFLDISRICNVKILNNKPQILNDKSYILNSPADPFLEAIKVCLEIKLRMKTEVGDWLTCSVGIAGNKLLAKIGSDMQKPDGIVVVSDEFFSEECRVQSDRLLQRLQTNSALYTFNSSLKTLPLLLTKEDLYKRLVLTDIPGIGIRMERRLNHLGIYSLTDLRDYPQTKLIASFGIQGRHLHSMGQLEGTWKPSVEEDEEIKSIGHMYTLPKEYRGSKYFIPVLYKLSEMVGRRLRRQELMGNILHFYARDKKYQGFGQSKKLGYFVQDGRDIFLECKKSFESLSADLKNISAFEIKLIGVTVAGLTPAEKQQSLFQKDQRSERIVPALDKINEKYGDFTICRTPVLKATDVFRDSIGFGRMKEFSRRKRK